jgi:hypothetical protein
MPQSVEANVAQNADGHGEDESRVQQNETGLSNMGVVEEDQAGCHNGRWQGVARLPHDQEDGGDGESSQEGRQSTEGNVGDLIGDIRVANIVEEKVPVIANEPAHEGEEELSEGRVYIEEVGSLEIEGCKLRVDDRVNSAPGPVPSRGGSSPCRNALHRIRPGLGD